MVRTEQRLRVEHVYRPESVILAPFDDLHVTFRSQPRYYAVTNPFPDGAELTVTFDDNGVNVTDGSAVISWPAATLARLGD